MIETYRRLQRKRAAGEIDGGFTLIELLIVIVVLGILAAIVVFALGGITGKSLKAACQADTKTVGTAVAALQSENPTSAPAANTDPQTTNAFTAKTWKGALLSTTTSNYAGAPFLQSWPTGGGTGSNIAYDIYVATSNTALVGAADVVNSKTLMPANVVPAKGDVIVHVLSSTVAADKGSYDATKYPVYACFALS
jgi:prepilin-type N-terminal cleavage/methylation domain-containing protein